MADKTPGDRIDRERVQTAVRYIRTATGGNPVDRDGAYDILTGWDRAADLSGREVAAVLRRFDL